MRQPRRVPWQSPKHFRELYDLLSAPGSDTDSRKRAMSRLSVYIASPSCPVFLLLTHDLVAASCLPAVSFEDRERARLGCGMAIVRFINGLVDPLQTGMCTVMLPISLLAAE